MIFYIWVILEFSWEKYICIIGQELDLNLFTITFLLITFSFDGLFFWWLGSRNGILLLGTHTKTHYWFLIFVIRNSFLIFPAHWKIAFLISRNVAVINNFWFYQRTFPFLFPFPFGTIRFISWSILFIGGCAQLSSLGLNPSINTFPFISFSLTSGWIVRKDWFS